MPTTPIPTLSRNQTLEVNGNRHPHGLAVLLGPEAPHADAQCLGARLRRQACKEERLFSEVVGFPALAFICGKPGDEKLAMNYYNYLNSSVVGLCKNQKISDGT